MHWPRLAVAAEVEKKSQRIVLDLYDNHFIYRERASPHFPPWRGPRLVNGATKKRKERSMTFFSQRRKKEKNDGDDAALRIMLLRTPGQRQAPLPQRRELVWL